VSDLV